MIARREIYAHNIIIIRLYKTLENCAKAKQNILMYNAIDSTLYNK
jgi:hypothetical protein